MQNPVVGIDYRLCHKLPVDVRPTWKVYRWVKDIGCNHAVQRNHADVAIVNLVVASGFNNSYRGGFRQTSGYCETCRSPSDN